MLNINPEKLFFIIVKAREFDAKVPPADSERGDNPIDDAVLEILEDRPDDATEQELIDVLETLNEDEMIDVVALDWLGRGDFGPEDWQAARAQAQERLGQAHGVGYLMGTPLLADYLEEAVSRLGYSMEEFELGRL